MCGFFGLACLSFFFQAVQGRPLKFGGSILLTFCTVFSLIFFKFFKFWSQRKKKELFGLRWCWVCYGYGCCQGPPCCSSTRCSKQKMQQKWAKSEGGLETRARRNGPLATEPALTANAELWWLLSWVERSLAAIVWDKWGQLGDTVAKLAKPLS